jgi:nucleotide-binding universal stress UspA family protein
MYTNLLVGLDGSAGSWHAYEQAVSYAKHAGAMLIGILAESPFWAPPPMGQRAFERMIAHIAAALARQHGVPFEFHVRLDYPAHAIVAEARVLHCDLIVLGHTSDDAVRRWYAGSVSARVALTAPCDVVVVRGGDVAELDRKVLALSDGSAVRTARFAL